MPILRFTGRRALVVGAGCVLVVAASGLLLPRARAALRLTPGFETMSAEPRILLEPGTRVWAEQIAAALPEAVERVVSVHGRPFRAPFRVYLPASHESFARRLGMPLHTPVRGMALARDVWISPLAFDFHGLDTHRQALAHELSHLHLGQWLGWWHRTATLPTWFQEGLADVVAGTGEERATRGQARTALLGGPRLAPDDRGRLPRPKRAGDYGLPWPIFHLQSKMFVEHLRGHRAAAFDGLLSEVLDGTPFATAFTASYERDLESEWACFLEAVAGAGADDSDTTPRAAGSASNGLDPRG